MTDIRASIQITGNDRKETRRFIEEITKAIEAQMKVSMSLPKSGREYKRGSRFHRASAAGEAPAVDTGLLVNSIQTRMISDTHGEITVNAEYAEYLEEGTAHIKPRPLVEPAIEGIIERFSKGNGIISRGSGG